MSYFDGEIVCPSVDVCAWCSDSECDGISCIAGLDTGDERDYPAIEQLHSWLRRGRLAEQMEHALAHAENRRCGCSDQIAASSPVTEQLVEEAAGPPAGGLLGMIVGEVSAPAPDTSPAPLIGAASADFAAYIADGGTQTWNEWWAMFSREYVTNSDFPALSTPGVYIPTSPSPGVQQWQLRRNIVTEVDERIYLSDPDGYSPAGFNDWHQVRQFAIFLSALCALADIAAGGGQ